MSDKSILNKKIENLYSYNINTLPFNLLKIFKNRNYDSLNYNEIFESIQPIYSSLKKKDNKPYGKNINKSLLSTLTSINLFTFDNNNNKYKVNEKNAIKYLKDFEDNNKNLFLNKKKEIIKSFDTKLNSNVNNNNNNNNIYNKKFLKKNKINVNINNNNSLKFLHAFNILDNILNEYSKNNNIKKKIINPYTKSNDSSDLIVNVGNIDMLIGILSCFKFFKPLLKKTIFKEYKKKDLGKKKIIDEEILKNKLNFVDNFFKNNEFK